MKAGKFVSKRLLTAAAFAGAVLSAGSLMAGRAVDDAAFNLAIRGDLDGDGTIDANELGSKLDFSADSPVTTVVQQPAGTGTPPSFKSESFATPMHPMTTNTWTVLDIPQDCKDEDGTRYVSATRIDLRNAAVMGSDTQTFYARFRWNGNYCTNKNVRCWIMLNRYYWNPKTGWGVGIEQPAGASYGTTCVVIPQQVKTISTDKAEQRIYPGRWYDLFVTVTPSGDNSVVQVDLLPVPDTRNNGAAFACAAFKSYTMGTNWGFPKLTFTPDSANNICLGGETVASGWTDIKTTSNNAVHTFNGAIARLMLWNRKLTWPERWEIASGCEGSMWSIGAINGSANEFAATDAAETFDVTNAWRFMRRSLTAENPTLTLKGALPANEAGRGHYVSITPLWGSGATSGTCPVQISVNGTSAGTFDLTQKRGRCAFIPGELWTRDEDGNATVAITRVAPFTKPLSFDAIVVGGSWAFGAADKKNYEFSAESEVARDAVAGDTVSKHVRRALLVSGSNYSTMRFLFYMPSEAAGLADGLFETALASTSGSMDSRLSGHASVDLYLNDVRVGGWENITSTSELSLAIPSKYICAGLNALVLSNATTQATLDGLKGSSEKAVGNWLNFDHYRFSCGKIRAVGLMLIVR